MSIDLERTKLLLDVVHAAAAAGPGYSNLIAMAGAELKAMEDEAVEEVAKVREEANKKAADKKVKAEAEEVKVEEDKVAIDKKTSTPPERKL